MLQCIVQHHMRGGQVQCSLETCLNVLQKQYTTVTVYATIMRTELGRYNAYHHANSLQEVPAVLEKILGYTTKFAADFQIVSYSKMNFLNSNEYWDQVPNSHTIQRSY